MRKRGEHAFLKLKGDFVSQDFSRRLGGNTTSTKLLLGGPPVTSKRGRRATMEARSMEVQKRQARPRTITRQDLERPTLA